MWWQEVVGYRQCSCYWYINIQQWNICRSCDGKYQWQYQYKVYFIEQGKINGKIGQYYCLLDVFFIKFGNQCGGDMLCVIVVCQYFVQYCVKIYDQGKVIECFVDIGFDGVNNFIQWYFLY